MVRLGCCSVLHRPISLMEEAGAELKWFVCLNCVGSPNSPAFPDVLQMFVLFLHFFWGQSIGKNIFFHFLKLEILT